LKHIYFFPVNIELRPNQGHLQARNEKLASLNTAIKNDYDVALKETQTLPAGYENLLWVKQLTTEDALLKAKAKKRQVDIEFPILGSAYKVQKFNNSRYFEAKKEFIKEATKG